MKITRRRLFGILIGLVVAKPVVRLDARGALLDGYGLRKLARQLQGEGGFWPVIRANEELHRDYKILRAGGIDHDVIVRHLQESFDRDALQIAAATIKKYNFTVDEIQPLL